jgi:hypothetical protein
MELRVNTHEILKTHLFCGISHSISSCCCIRNFSTGPAILRVEIELFNEIEIVVCDVCVVVMMVVEEQGSRCEPCSSLMFLPFLVESGYSVYLI